jgi:ABC-2 type transport system permease protein
VRALWAQAGAETRLTLRRGESLLLTLGIPVGLLCFLALTKVFPAPTDRVSYLVPGILALAVMSTGLVSLSIATAFERDYQVLKRLGATPLGRGRLVMAKILSVVVVEVVQVAVIAAVGVALGWSPPSGALLGIAGAVVGTSAFAGLGLAMAGRLRGDIVLALANALWLVLLLLGGMLFPLSKLPGAIHTASSYLPADALATVLRATTTGGAVPAHAWAVLGAWAVAGPALAAVVFRWE